MFGFVWLRFGLAMFGSKINGIGYTDAACKISAQSDLIWLSYSFPQMGTALDIQIQRYIFDDTDAEQALQLTQWNKQFM